MRRSLSCLALAMLAACSAGEPKRIIGHWEAENFQLQGLGLPIGPALDIDADALRVSGSAISLPISRMEATGDDVKLLVPGGVNLTFRFDSGDRMHIDVPLLGSVYYQRRGATPAAAAPVAPTVQATAPAPAVPTRPPAGPLPPGEASFTRAHSLAQAHDADEALRQLEQALQQGYRNWGQLDASEPLQALRNDPRYEAMMARWRSP